MINSYGYYYEYYNVTASPYKYTIFFIRAYGFYKLEVCSKENDNF